MTQNNLPIYHTHVSVFPRIGSAPKRGTAT